MMLSNIVNFERSVSSDRSEQVMARVVQEISDERNLRFSQYERTLTHVAYVEDSKGRELAYGLGKGVQSRIGALGECLEHLHYRDVGSNSATVLKLQSFRDSDVHNTDAILRYAFTLEGVPSEIMCIPFEELQSEATLFIPRIFVNYHFLDVLEDESPFRVFLSRYVTTSGTAFGLSEDDALLHALNEIVERDITSEFFLWLSHGDYNIKNKFAKLSTSSLPAYFATLTSGIRDRFDATEVDIFVCRTPFGQWWSICIAHFPQDSPFILPQWGAGCSMSYDLAIYRGVSECIQMLDNYQRENKVFDKRFLRFVGVYPQFRRIASFSVPDAVNNVPYNADANVEQISIRGQIETIVAKMAQLGHRPAKHIAAQTESYCVVCVYAPNLERFYNISKSVPVLPIGYIDSYP